MMNDEQVEVNVMSNEEVFNEHIKDVINDYMIEADLPENGHIEVHVNDELVFSNQKGAEIDNLDPKVEGRLEVGKVLSQGMSAPTLENVRITGHHDDKKDIFFEVNSESQVTKNIIQPFESINERIQNIVDNKKVKAIGVKEIAEVVKELASELQKMNDTMKVQDWLIQQNIKAQNEQVVINSVSNVIVNELNHESQSLKISNAIVAMAKTANKPISKDGKDFMVSASPEGDANIWRKEENNEPTLIYAQSKGEVEFNEMSQKDIFKLSSALEKGRKVSSSKPEQTVQKPEIKQQVEKPLLRR